ncbi:hypothetical protein VCHENC02_0652B, partial [Vibrio harveyi]
CPLFIC